MMIIQTVNDILAGLTLSKYKQSSCLGPCGHKGAPELMYCMLNLWNADLCSESDLAHGEYNHYIYHYISINSLWLLKVLFDLLVCCLNNFESDICIVEVFS